MKSRGKYNFALTSGNRVGRSVFDLSYIKRLTGNMGYLYPILCEEMVPGDKFVIGNEMVFRFFPLVAPVLHEINVFVHYFFVPYRLLWSSWEDFITTGELGDDASVLPTWSSASKAVGTLWDYFGFPVDVAATDGLPVAWPLRAYNLVWNEYYRNERLQTAVNIETSEDILRPNWEKDYFTSMLATQQLGDAAAFPLSGIVNTSWPAGSVTAGVPGSPQSVNFADTGADSNAYVNGSNAAQNFRDFLARGSFDASGISSFDVNDMRFLIQLQRWQELNNRAGTRYTEYLLAHYGVHNGDSRLQRPEYVGGTKNGVVVSAVIQTSETNTTPQGNLTGNGVAVGRGYAGRHFATEFGVILGIMFVRPRTSYEDGINRQWLKTNPYDYFNPAFVHLSEQGVFKAELCNIAGTGNEAIIGYQGMYDEMRYKPNMTVGKLRTTFNNWHLGRQFNHASPPGLNSAFITCDPRTDIFADQAEHQFVCEFGNLIKAVRPLPYTGMPGLLDHV